MEPSSLLSAAASLLVAGLNLTSTGDDTPVDPAIYKTTTDICRDIGLACETHTVETEDGYLLTAHRIPVPEGVPRRGALLAVSGLVGCSDNFFLSLPTTSMPETLASAGYDVVLGNTRGTPYSTGHRRWSRAQPQYWRFTPDDVGEYDVEALVSLTQRVTGEARPFYVGYSSGAIVLYTWLQRRPRADNLLRGAMLWAPPIFYTKPHSVYLTIADLIPEAVVRWLWQRPGDLLPRPLMAAHVAWPLCRPGAALWNACQALFQLITGLTLDSDALSQLHVIIAHATCGVPSSMVAHILQIAKAKRVQAFDFGRQENLSRYGSERPPQYWVHNSTLPTAFFLGTRDRLISFEEAMRQIGMMPRNDKRMVVPVQGYGHLHFLSDKNNHRLVFERMLSFMSEL